MKPELRDNEVLPLMLTVDLVWANKAPANGSGEF